MAYLLHEGATAMTQFFVFGRETCQRTVRPAAPLTRTTRTRSATAVRVVVSTRPAPSARVLSTRPAPSARVTFGSLTFFIDGLLLKTERAHPERVARA
jgi:hypothetical protein